VFLVLALLQLAMPDAIVEGQTRISLASVVQLACVPIVGPAGAGLVGLVLGLTQGRDLPRRNRLFNAAAFSLVATVAGVVFRWSGGSTDPAGLGDPWGVVVNLALPLLVADIAQALVNLVLLAAVIRVALGLPMRAQMLSIVRGTGLAYIGYGVIALIMVVLWEPADLGAASVAVVLAPLLVAQWVYRQRAEEIEGQQRALEVLVAALEAKAPHLAGHSARVADLSARIAELLGLSPQQVADTRIAGMLHDVGQTSLPTRTVRRLDLSDATTDDSGYPRSGAALLDDLTFLHGSLDAIREHRTAGTNPAEPLPSRIVALADRYDLLTRVGTPDGEVHTSTQARDLVVAELADGPGSELVRALDEALARSRSEETAS
jgi:hypothetical protein